MLFVVCGQSYSRYESVAPIFNKAGITELIESQDNVLTTAEKQQYFINQTMNKMTWCFDSLDSIPSWQALDSNIHFILVYASLEFVITSMLEQGENIQSNLEQIIETWAQYNKPLLNFYLTSPKQSLLVNSQAFLFNHQNQLLKAMVCHFELHLSPLSTQELIQCRPPLIAFLYLARNILSTVMPIKEVKLGLFDQPSLSDNDYQTVLILYHQLESYADLPYIHAISIFKEREQVFNDYNQLVIQLNNIIETASTEKQQLQNKIKQLEQAYFLLESKNQNQNQLLKELQQTILQLTEQKKSSDNQNKNLDSQNKTLLYQLHDMQKDLETYHLNNQKLSEKFKQNERLLLTNNKNILENIESLTCSIKHLKIDFTKKSFYGENWYEKEVNGCWAGPKKQTTIELPRLLDGNYELSFEITDAMHSEIYNKMIVSISGIILENKLTQESVKLTQLFKKKKEFPKIMTFYFNTSQLKEQKRWTVKLNFPYVIPANTKDKTTTDNRLLAIKLKSLILRVIEDAN